MPIEEPSFAGFTISGRPSRCATALKSVFFSRTAYGGVGRPSASHRRLVRSLSMASAEASTPLPVYGNAEPFEDALHRAVLAEAAVQRNERFFEFLFDQIFKTLFRRIERMRVDALLAQRGEHHAAALQRHLALGRLAAEEDRDLHARPLPRCAPRESARRSSFQELFVLHLVDQPFDVGGARRALRVDDEVGVLLGHAARRRAPGPSGRRTRSGAPRGRPAGCGTRCRRWAATAAASAMRLRQQFLDTRARRFAVARAAA